MAVKNEEALHPGRSRGRTGPTGIGRQAKSGALPHSEVSSPARAQSLGHIFIKTLTQFFKEKIV